MVILKPLYRIPKARTYQQAIYYKYYKEKLFIITTKKEIFSLVGIQTDDILILILKEFSALEDDEFNKIKFFIKFKEALAPETLLIFNRCILI